MEAVGVVAVGGHGVWRGEVGRRGEEGLAGAVLENGSAGGSRGGGSCMRVCDLHRLKRTKVGRERVKLDKNLYFNSYMLYSRIFYTCHM